MDYVILEYNALVEILESLRASPTKEQLGFLFFSCFDYIYFQLIRLKFDSWMKFSGLPLDGYIP